MSETQLTRSDTDKMLAGICGGLAAYLGIDSVLVRALFAFLVFASGMVFQSTSSSGSSCPQTKAPTNQMQKSSKTTLKKWENSLQQCQPFRKTRHIGCFANYLRTLFSIRRARTSALAARRHILALNHCRIRYLHAYSTPLNKQQKMRFPVKIR